MGTSSIEIELNAKIDKELQRTKSDKESGDTKGKSSAYREMSDTDLLSSIVESLSTIQAITQLVQKNNVVIPPPMSPAASAVYTPPPMPARVVDEDIDTLTKELLYNHTDILFKMVKALVEKDVG